MATTLVSTGDRSVLVTNPAERRQAGELLQELHGHPERLQVLDGPDRRRPLPADLVAVLSRVLEAMAAGGSITIGSLPEELSTSVAAEQLGISRPTLMKMIAAGEISAHKVGSHHRLKTANVLAAKRARLERQRHAFDELRELEAALDEL